MRLETVSKRYAPRQPWVIRDVTRDVAAGQLIRVEGQNGSGKSTLLQIIAGALVPSAGRVTGRPRTGYVPERFPGALAFPARDYLLHLSRIHGLSGAAGRAAVEEWLERLGATEYAAAPLRTLSKGMCQKIAVAQALLSRPELLILDEAWTGLDQSARGTLDAAVGERVTAGGTVCYVDHDPARLASTVTERWQLAGGALQVVSGPGAGGPSAGGPSAGSAAGPGPDGRAVTIEIDGLEADSLQRLVRLAGVLAVVADPGGGPGRRGPVRVRVSQAASDAVLRELLTWDGVHVFAVRP